jgi:hypothetical protein
MFEKILVPTDFSAYAHKVLECVGDIHGVKEVVLLNVVARPTLSRLWDSVVAVKDAKRKLTEEKRFIKVPVVVRHGCPCVGKRNRWGYPTSGKRGERFLGSHGSSWIKPHTERFYGKRLKKLAALWDRHLLIMRYKSVGVLKACSSLRSKAVLAGKVHD